MLFWTSLDVTADSGKPTGLPACAYPLYTAPSMHHAVKLRYNLDIQVKSGPLQCIRHLGFASTLYIRLRYNPECLAIPWTAWNLRLALVWHPPNLYMCLFYEAIFCCCSLYKQLPGYTVGTCYFAYLSAASNISIYSIPVAIVLRHDHNSCGTYVTVLVYQW